MKILGGRSNGEGSKFPKNKNLYVGAAVAKPKSSSTTFTSNSLNNGEVVSVVIEDTNGSGCEFTPPGIPVVVTDYPVASLTSTSVILSTICDIFKITVLF